jgi:D-alanyl-lipoteichoic acid acyltransferase DltB (MBOAT superfamily)
MFQSIAYIIDVYKGRIIPEKNIIHFSLFSSFFAQLLAGPIERAQNLLPQLKGPIRITSYNFHVGFKFFLWGFFKKVLVADKLELIASPIFNQPSLFHGSQTIIGIIAYSFQIYCDFSGYCDMGMGLAKILGIELSLNFFRPYTATSFRDFWQRWHITLMKWFRTFIYIPLGGSKVYIVLWIRNLFIVFFLSALWHGVTLPFIIWGMLHFSYYFFERIIYQNSNLEKIIPRIIKQLSVFTLVCFAWIFFRSSTIQDALTMVGNMFSFNHLDSPISFSNGIFSLNNSLKFNYIQLMSILLPFLIFIIFEFFGLIDKYFKEHENGELNITEIAFVNIVFVLSFFLIVTPSQQFIYFQF